MTSKKAKKEPSMELEIYEITALSAIQDSRMALAELQRAVMPFAEKIAKESRIWWDRVLDARGLTREGTSYTIENGRTIVDQLTKEPKEGK